MSEVTVRQLRYNQLRKQCLLFDNSLSFKEIIKNQLGLHSTSYWTPYLSIYARIGDYEPKKVFEAINQGDELVRINCFRLAVFLVHAVNLTMILKVTGKSLYNYYIRSPPLKALSEEEIEQVLEKIRFALKDGSKKIHQLKKEISELAENKFILRLAMAKGEVVRAEAKNAKTTLTSYDLTQNRFSEVKLDSVTEKEAKEQIIYKYIQVFGPVSEADISWWLPLTKRETKEILESLSGKLMTHHINQVPFYVEKEDYEFAGSIENHLGDHIFFLPYEDHFPKAFTDRWYLDSTTRERLFPRSFKSFWPEKPIQIITTGPNSSGEIRPSIWLNESIIGRWEIEKIDENYKVVMSVYKKTSVELMSEIEEKRTQLEKFINEKLQPIS